VAGVLVADVADGPVTVLVRPEDLDLVVDQDGPAVVADVDYVGPDRLVLARLDDGTTLTARLPARSALAVGDRVRPVAHADGPAVAFPAG
jgi:hypothetical protein